MTTNKWLNEPSEYDEIDAAEPVIPATPPQERPSVKDRFGQERVKDLAPGLFLVPQDGGSLYRVTDAQGNPVEGWTGQWSISGAIRELNTRRKQQPGDRDGAKS